MIFVVRTFVCLIFIGVFVFALGLVVVPVGEKPCVVSGVTETIDVNNQTATFTFEVNPGEAAVKDVHILAPRGVGLVKPKKDKDKNPIVKMPTNWKFSRSGTGRSYHFFSGSKGAPLLEKTPFSVTVPLKNDKLPTVCVCNFAFTKDGGKILKTSQTIHTVNKNKDGYYLEEPCVRLVATLGPGSSVVADGYLLVNIRTELYGAAYQIYYSRSLATAPEEDALGIGLNTSDTPPPSWITSTERLRGAFEIIVGKGVAQARLNLGSDPAMEGAHLYIVATIDLDNDGMPDIFNVPPVEVLLQL